MEEGLGQSEAGSRSRLGSIWAPIEGPHTAPSVFSFAVAAVLAVFVAWLVMNVLLALGYLGGLVTSDNLSAAVAYDRASWGARVIVLPATAVVYLFGIRALATWFANRPTPWIDAAFALLIMIGSGLVFAWIDLGIGPLSTLVGCALVTGFLRRQAGRRTVPSAAG